MLAGDVPRMRRLGIDYVVIGPWEFGQATEKQFTIGTVFDDPDVFEVVLDETFDGRDWKLLSCCRGRTRVRTPSRRGRTARTATPAHGARDDDRPEDAP